MNDERKMLEGTCKYCGQSQLVEAETESEANNKATSICKCEEGQASRRIETAKSHVETKFEEFSKETIELIQSIVAGVNYGVIDSATLKLSRTVKVSITLTSKDKLSVTRTDTEVDKEEI